MRTVGHSDRGAASTRSVKRAVEHDRHAVGVVPEVRELVVAVAVVGVDRHEPRVERRHRGLDVLGAVVEVDGDLVLQPRAALDERRAERVDPAEELAVA